jgi:uncharacterized repeat protein (TIGR01451 family)
MGMVCNMVRKSLLAVVILGCGLFPAPSRADCILGISENTSHPAFTGYTNIFPNWQMAPTAAFSVYFCPDTWCPTMTTSAIRSVTVVNYGTATAGGDITGMYFNLVCFSSKIDLWGTMTYAGVWGGQPAWTWAGDYNLGADPGSQDCNYGYPNLFLYTDVAPCPTEGRTVYLGLRPHWSSTYSWEGGITDSWGCSAPMTTDLPVQEKTIRYVAKVADREQASPGDTINYTVYYGRPGTGSLDWIRILDSVPSYLSLLYPTINPAADPGWDPVPGSPMRLRWTIPGPLATAGGPTGRVRFSVTVDWGNGDSFEPGSGDVAAPNGEFLFNQAHMSWSPVSAGCPTGMSSNRALTVVKWFLFWKMGDNDMLFSPRVGLPDDEMIYSIFVKNVSPTMTWWKVSVWDTVPSQLDPWQVDCGMEDPCVGWTMTPTGCAPASAGKVLSGLNTILTWRLDAPPLMTLTLRWKAKVRKGSVAGEVCRNSASILPYGQSGIVNGTGHAGREQVFIHEAPIILRTTYISYVGWAGSDNSYFECGMHPQTFLINFYPLNKMTNFALYKKWCCAAAPCDTSCAVFAATGGVSPPITDPAGSCMGGGADWIQGCKAERAPASFRPAYFAASALPALPYNFLHKVVGNSPVIWELSTCGPFPNGDATTYAGTTSMTFQGLISYTYLRVNTSYGSNVLEPAFIANTRADVPTTVHVFKWSALIQGWDYVRSAEIYNESQWAFIPTEYENHYRFVSSVSPIIIFKGYVMKGFENGPSYNDFGSLVPNKETGTLVSGTVPATFYAWAGHVQNTTLAVSVGNVGAANASYEVWRYTPDDTTLPSPSSNVTSDLVGSSGRWIFIATHSVAAGLAAAGNPHHYGPSYDNSTFVNTFRLYKIKLLSGGPIQVVAGRDPFHGYSGGSMMHPSDPAGGLVGKEFWLHLGAIDTTYDCGGRGIEVFDVFCPKQGTVIRNQSSGGYSARYTTASSDQCVAFKAITGVATGARTNYRISVDPAGADGIALAQYIACKITEKIYTAPFMSTGIHYEIIAPPVVFVGQSFWITLVAVEAGGSTKTDYNGLTSFTSTDSTAKIQGSAMEGYNYTWGGCGTDCGVKVFVNVSFTQLGLQTLVASDVFDGSITGLEAIMVVGADVRLEKRKKLTIAASGDTVQFWICWSNYSTATAYSFTITDAVPNGTTYVPELAGNAICGQDGPYNASVSMAASSSTSTTPPNTAFVYVAPATTPAATTRWLRWTVRDVYVNSTGCVCFKVVVN